MLARETLYRLAADMPHLRTHNVHQLARFVQQSLSARKASNVPVLRAISCAYTSALGARRSYATATRAKKATTPTKTVKRAVKAKAAAKKPVKKAASAAKKKKAAPAKKKVVRKKAVAKKRVTKKPTPRRRVKKVLSPEEKEKASIRELRKKALKEPIAYGHISAINAYVSELTKNSKSSGGITLQVTELMKKWKTLTPAEHERYNHLANEMTAANRAQYTAWIRTHTPDQIRIANNARVLLRQKLAGTLKSKKYPAHTSKLHDERQAKQPIGSYIYFSKDRWSSGDFKGIKNSEAAKLISKEWKALSAGEKKKYEDEAAADMARYKREKSAAGIA